MVFIAFNQSISLLKLYAAEIPKQSKDVYRCLDIL